MKFRKLSFQRKLYLSCITLNLVILFICSLVFYYYTTNSLKQNMQDSVSSNTALLLKDLDGILEDADNILKELQTNQTLYREARAIPDADQHYFANHVTIRTTFQNAFRSVLVSRDYSGSLSYISNYHDNVGVSSSSGQLPYLKKELLRSHPEINRLLAETSYDAYLPPHLDYWENSETVFSVVRTMRDTYRSYGILEIDLKISVLEDLLNDFENPENYSIVLLDEKQQLVYSSSEQLDQTALHNAFLSAAANHSSGTFSYEDLSLSGYDVSPKTGWTFILNTGTAGYLRSLKQLLVITAVLFSSLFIIMSAFLYVLTHRLTRPLKQLSQQLNHLEPGRNINISEISSSDEVTMLTNAVQAFLAEIYDQNQRLTESKKRTLQAHYDAMEAQLNPHFLYNTLSVIGMTGLSGGNINVSRMCSELANLLRYSLSYTGQSVRLEQEITNAASYLYIMKMRYEENLEYDWSLDQTLDHIHVPKLILQPLIENCFQHAFQQTEQEILPPWKIRISSACDVTCWYLAVTNNGAPFAEEKLTQLHKRLQHFKLPDYIEEISQESIMRQGFGLENTILRLNFYYRGREYFAVTSTQQEGTTVTIGGPLHFENLL